MTPSREIGPDDADRRAPQYDRRDRSLPDGERSEPGAGPIEETSHPDGRDRTPSKPVNDGKRDPRDPWMGGG